MIKDPGLLKKHSTVDNLLHQKNPAFVAVVITAGFFS
jgi:hypothetical protein